MKKLKVIGITITVLAVIIAILLHNKSQIAAKSKNDKIEAYPVTVTTVGNENISNTLELVGTITANNDVAIVSEAAGRVTRVYAQVGDYKSAGSILFQLDDELKLAAFKTAESNYQKTKKDLERYEVLYKNNSVTDAQYEGARLAFQAAEGQYIFAKREYSDTKITTPISGIVTSKMVDIGNYVNKNTPVANVVDISKLKVKLNVGEKDAFKLKNGDEVHVFTDVYPGVEFKGRIESISSKGDDAHTYPVEITLPNSKEKPLKAGMFGKIEFVSIKDSESLVIPREALVGSIKDAKVYVVNNGIAQLRNVTIGSAYESFLEIKGGINSGEQIVVNGQNNLQDSDKVIIRN